MARRKGQLELEMLIAMAILTFFLVSFLVFYMVKEKDVFYLNNYLEARKICFDLKNTVENIFSGGNGTRINFTIPEKLNGQDYKIKVDSSAKIIRISWDDKVYSCFVSANVSNKTHVYFEIPKGKNFGYNYEGSVLIE